VREPAKKADAQFLATLPQVNPESITQVQKMRERKLKKGTVLLTKRADKHG